MRYYSIVVWLWSKDFFGGGDGAGLEKLACFLCLDLIRDCFGGI